MNALQGIVRTLMPEQKLDIAFIPSLYFGGSDISLEPCLGTGNHACTYTIEQTCSNRIRCVLEALIKRGGGKRPDEARQPACIVRKGANSGGIFRKMRGICNKAKTPAYRGFFVSWIFL